MEKPAAVQLKSAVPQEDIERSPGVVIDQTPTEGQAAKECSEIVVSVDKPFRPSMGPTGSVIQTSSAGADVDMDELGKVVFGDMRWKNGLEFLKSGEGWNHDQCAGVLREGAQSFGIRQLSDAALEGLVDQMMGNDSKPSPALRRWIKDHDFDPHNMKIDVDVGVLSERMLTTQKTMDDKDVKSYITKMASKRANYMSVEEWKGHIANADYVKRFKWGISGSITLISFLYAIKVVAHMYPGKDGVPYATGGVLDRFGWPVFFARLGGMGCALWTAILYLTMSRTFLTWVSKKVPKTEVWLTFFDAHKDLHIMAGISLTVMSLEHVFMHAIGTIPGLLASTTEEINGILGCANVDDTPGYIDVDLSAFHWPKCPVEEVPRTFTEAAFTTMPGVSGMLLCVLLAAVAYTGRIKGRKEHFDRFIYLHNVLVILWPILLFLHGSQGWIGLGFPLVVFTASIPVSLYILDRTLRALRYYLYSGKQVRIVSCTVRPGDKHNTGLTYLRISPPPHLWQFAPGMYAFICMPGYAPLQWHPFTICSGSNDPTVDFLIAGIGDWTQALARECTKGNNKGIDFFPQVAIDGPYAAPTLSALSKNVLIAVGAGVGITPFLSLMSSINSMIEQKGDRVLPLKEVHFYWLTRSIDEFMFGRDLFSKIVSHPHLRDRVFLHLHCTAREPNKDPASFMFREALKKQSALDRKAFTKVFSHVKEVGAQMLTGLQLPWSWVNGSMQDVVWLGHILRSQNREVESMIRKGHALEGHEDHWSHQLLKAKPSLEETLSKIDEEALGATCSVSEVLASGGTQSTVEELLAEEAKLMLPVVFGRPDFGTEVRAIGKARPEYDVDIYICGNDAIVKGLQDVVTLCEQHAQRDFDKDGGHLQKYTVHYERFG